MGCLHDKANVQQFTCILNTFAESFLEVCWIVQTPHYIAPPLCRCYVDVLSFCALIVSIPFLVHVMVTITGVWISSNRSSSCN